MAIGFGARAPMALTVLGMAAGTGLLATAFGGRGGSATVASRNLIPQDFRDAPLSPALQPFSPQAQAARAFIPPPPPMGSYGVGEALASTPEPTTAGEGRVTEPPVFHPDTDPYRKSFDGQVEEPVEDTQGAAKTLSPTASTAAGTAESRQAWSPTSQTGASTAPNGATAVTSSAGGEDAVQPAPALIVSAQNAAALSGAGGRSSYFTGSAPHALPAAGGRGSTPTAYTETPGRSTPGTIALAPTPPVPEPQAMPQPAPTRIGGPEPTDPTPVPKASGLIAKVRAASMEVAAEIKQVGGYHFDGRNDCYGFVRRVWDPILKAMGQAPLPVADAPSEAWAPITSFAALIPGDVLATDQGHAWGEHWHGGLFAGMVGGTPYIHDNSGSLGPSVRPHPPGLFKFYYRRTHALLAASR